MKTQSREKPGSSGEGNYYHVEVLPKTGFVTFRTQDVGDPGHIQRVAGKKSNGSWQTVKWLIGKEDAHVEGNKLVPDTKDAKEVLKDLGIQPVHLDGDRFNAKSSSAKSAKSAKPKAKPTARRTNVKKAPSARKK
jgi:hypothetical protein